MADNNNQAKDVEKAKETKPAKPKKEKVPFTQRLSKFWKSNIAELKKVTWYGKTQTINSTLLVLAALIICSAAICLLDFGFSSVIDVLSKIF